MPLLAMTATLVGLSGCGGQSERGQLEGEPSAVRPPPCGGANAPLSLLPFAGKNGGAVRLDVRGKTLLATRFGDDLLTEISVVDLDTTATNTLARVAIQASWPALRGDQAYWIEQGSLMHAPVDGSLSPQRVAGASTGSVVIDDVLYYGRDNVIAALPLQEEQAVLLATDAAPLELASDGEYLYFSSCVHGLGRIPKLGGEVEPLSGGCPVSLAADETDVYFTDLDPFTSQLALFRVASSGGQPTLFQASVLAPQAIAVDEHAIYVGGSQGLFRIRRDLLEPELLAPGNVTDIALDADCIYFANSEQGNVFELQKYQQP